MTDEPTDGNSLYYYNLWMNARSENGELREELQHEREFSRAGATAFANKEAAYASHGKAQATEIATLRATHARQADTITRLTREHAEVVARLEVMRAEVVGVRAERDALAAELADERMEHDLLKELLSRPEIDEFEQGMMLEAAHQRQRWGDAHDRNKSAENWYWLTGYLAGKALRSAIEGDQAKARHHTISSAAALFHWWRAIKESADGVGRDTDLAALNEAPKP